MDPEALAARRLQRHEEAKCLRPVNGRVWWPWDKQRAEDRLWAAVTIEASTHKLRSEIKEWMPGVRLGDVVRL
jgi:hypothetical protein